jgi:hypothetical protein
MSATVESVLSIAMTLSAAEQRELAERLWETATPPDDAVFDEATWTEIGRRGAASDADEVVHVRGEEVLAAEKFTATLIG